MVRGERGSWLPIPAPANRAPPFVGGFSGAAGFIIELMRMVNATGKALGIRPSASAGPGTPASARTVVVGLLARLRAMCGNARRA